MDSWLAAALDYVPKWLEFQVRHQERPGLVIAMTLRGRVILEKAFGSADLVKDEALTPRHRFRVASHSKSFTAAGVMRLREQGRVRLDDPVGRYVAKLHPSLAATTLEHLLSHGSGAVRDGTDSGYWSDRRPFVDRDELLGALAAPPILDASTQFKYSNFGYGLLGLVIEAITQESYSTWIEREIIGAAQLSETSCDMPIARHTPFARGHSAKWPLGRRVRIPAENLTNALAPATGLVSTASDLARFFGQLDPSNRTSPLSRASRREMLRPRWRDTQSGMTFGYGLGVMSGTVGEISWFGHAGFFQGFVGTTFHLPEHGISISILTNSADGLAHPWLDGVVRILGAFAKRGAARGKKLAPWTGRWWDASHAIDLLPMGDRVLVASPALFNPLQDALEIALDARGAGRITKASAFSSRGEPARLVKNAAGRVVKVWLGATEFRSKESVIRELDARYGGSRPKRGSIKKSKT